MFLAFWPQCCLPFWPKYVALKWHCFFWVRLGRVWPTNNLSSNKGILGPGSEFTLYTFLILFSFLHPYVGRLSSTIVFFEWADGSFLKFVGQRNWLVWCSNQISRISRVEQHHNVTTLRNAPWQELNVITSRASSKKKHKKWLDFHFNVAGRAAFQLLN